MKSYARAGKTYKHRTKNMKMKLSEAMNTIQEMELKHKIESEKYFNELQVLK